MTPGNVIKLQIKRRNEIFFTLLCHYYALDSELLIVLYCSDYYSTMNYIYDIFVFYAFFGIMVLFGNNE